MSDRLDKKIDEVLYCPGCDERNQHIDVLKAELAAEKAKHIEIGQARYKTIQKLEADNTRLREALKMYGEHKPDCDLKNRPPPYFKYSCDCGLHQTLADPQEGWE